MPTPAYKRRSECGAFIREKQAEGRQRPRMLGETLAADRDELLLSV
ncbi:hypothetical protein [Actinocorallia longicatena]|uniref:Uncharacterized protein n=1 Tax=Actinocorallia longicatena TaxID=111803 RepID=A0ABP6QA79_9ACTN